MKKGIYYIMTVIGLLLLGVGAYFVKMVIEPQGIMKTLPYICIGLGCGIFGYGAGEVISHRVMKNHPDIRKDERNVAIANRAKARGYDMMIFIFAALMGVDFTVVLLLAFSYLFVVGYSLYYRFKYDREM
ncbi:conserved membrane hypothetical protein [Clostridiaceae bacterium BL-3]|nr:conserved membrane hypothetical protein [Clostridiaceae bacterium BL-3]